MKARSHNSGDTPEFGPATFESEFIRELAILEPSFRLCIWSTGVGRPRALFRVDAKVPGLPRNLLARHPHSEMAASSLVSAAWRCRTGAARCAPTRGTGRNAGNARPMLLLGNEGKVELDWARH